jgi:hypothetical protein
MSVLGLPPYMRQQSILSGPNTPDAQYVLRALQQGAQGVQPPASGSASPDQFDVGKLKDVFGADSADTGDKLKALLSFLGG